MMAPFFLSPAYIISVRENYSHKQWMLELCERMLRFYPKEIKKITARQIAFEKIKERWQSKPDDA